MSNPVDSFFSAVSVLAGHGNIKQRLTRAYEDYLAGIDEDVLPGTIQKPFAELRRELNRVEPLNGEGSVCASVRKMSVDDADRCARLMVDMYGIMIRNGKRSTALRRPPEEQTSVPPFLVKSG